MSWQYWQQWHALQEWHAWQQLPWLPWYIGSSGLADLGWLFEAEADVDIAGDELQYLSVEDKAAIDKTILEFQAEEDVDIADVDIAGELQHLSVEGLAAIDKTILEFQAEEDDDATATLTLQLAPFKQTLEDCLSQAVHDGNLATRMASGLLQVDNLLLQQTRRPVVLWLKVLQLHAQDLAVLACSMNVDQTPLKRHGKISPELKMSMETAFGWALQDLSLWSRLGNSKAKLFCNGIKWGHKHRKRKSHGSRSVVNVVNEGSEGSIFESSAAASSGLNGSSGMERFAQPPGLPPAGTYAMSGSDWLGGKGGGDATSTVGNMMSASDWLDGKGGGDATSTVGTMMSASDWLDGKTTPTGPRTTLNCSHMTCSHIHRSPTESPIPEREPEKRVRKAL